MFIYDWTLLVQYLELAGQQMHQSFFQKSNIWIQFLRVQEILQLGARNVNFDMKPILRIFHGREKEV